MNNEVGRASLPDFKASLGLRGLRGEIQWNRSETLRTDTDWCNVGGIAKATHGKESYQLPGSCSGHA